MVTPGTDWLHRSHQAAVFVHMGAYISSSVQANSSRPQSSRPALSSSNNSGPAYRGGHLHSSHGRRPMRLSRHNPWAFQTAVSEALKRRGYIDALWDALSNGDKSSHRAPVPCEVLPLILHFAGSYKEMTLSKEEPVRISNGNFAYLTHPIPTNLHGHQVVGARISVTSHDQGWSSEHPHLRGTYIGSYTWGEALVVESSSPTSTTEQGIPRVVVGTEVYRNLHAVKIWQTHEKTFVGPLASPRGKGQVDEESKEEGVQSDGGDLISALRPGRALALHLHAQYPGWTNFTQGAHITIQYLRVD